MTTSPPERPNPLARALDAAAATPEARAYAVPVERVRRRVRRRRAWRAAGAVGLALVVVAGGAGAVRAGLDGWPDGGRVSAPTGVGTSAAASTADWPAQFGRCGQPADEALPDLAADGMTLTLAGVPATLPADGTWIATATLDRGADGTDPVAVLWGTDLTVVRDGVVVGVQHGGRQVPDLSQSLADRLGGSSLETSPFPLVTDVALGLASCDPYPSGTTGSANLAPGTYEIVVTQTISWAAPEPGRSGAAAVPLDASPGTGMTDARVSTRTSVTITAPEATTDTDPTACGASEESLRTLADPQTNPAPFQVTVDGHPSPSGYDRYPMTASLTNTGTTSVTGAARFPTLVLTRGGIVVARSVVSGGSTQVGAEGAASTPGPPASADGYDLGTLAPGGAVGFPDPPLATPCDGGTTLAPGDYEMWVVVTVRLGGDGPLREDTVASAPRPWTQADPADPAVTGADPSPTAT